jgi:hypothetical protein
MVDAAWLFGKEDLSDAQLVIVEEEAGDADAAAATTAGERAAEPACGSSGNDDTKAATDDNEQPEPAAKRSRADSSSEGAVALPIHRAVVMSASGFFKARLGAWQQSSSNGAAEPCRVVLHVPPGQLEIGRRLVRAMYEDAPSFSDLSIEQRVQLLRLADRYGAAKVAKAAAAAAIGIDVDYQPGEELAWATVRAAYPPPHPEEDSEEDDAPPLAPALRQYAADALQELYGDLEGVWAVANDGARLNLLQLPFAAIKALLADERTRVASENTVVHTIVDWVYEHELKRDSARVKQLLALVRVARLTPNYARTVFCESKLARDHLSAGERAHASMLPLVGDEPSAGSRIVGAGSHWRLPARPRSALADAVVLEWSPSLAELEDLVAALPAQGEGRSSMYGPEGVIWQGWPLYLQLQSKRSASGDLMLLPGLAVELPCRTAGALIGYTLEAAAASGGGGITSRLKLRLFSAGVTSWRIPNFFGRGQAGGAGPPKDWAGVEAALRAKRLVHDDGDGDGAHLKLRCTVTQLQ